jgi:hypothetical protein
MDLDRLKDRIRRELADSVSPVAGNEQEIIRLCRLFVAVNLGNLREDLAMANEVAAKGESPVYREAFAEIAARKQREIIEYEALLREIGD